MNGLPSLANNLAAKGRYGDSMLMHVSPGEVKGLQALALANGGSLTINPDTGLPEAFKLKDLLPMIAGFALGPAGLALMPAWGAGLAVGGVEALRTGDIGKGLMAGLGAYGGAGLGQALTSAGTASAGNMAANLGVQGAGAGAGSQAAQLAAQNAGFGQAGLEATRQAAATATGANMAPALSNLQLAGQGISGLAQPGGFSNLATGLGQAFPSTMGKTAATMGLSAPLMQQEPMAFPTPEDPYANYKGPYTPSTRAVSYPDEDFVRSSREFRYFDPSNPVPFAEGGEVAPAAMPVTSNQMEVFRNIANIQQLAGLPSIANMPMQVMPSAQPSLAATPIASPAVANGGVTGEQDYGFQSMTKPTEASSFGSMAFYQPKSIFDGGRKFTGFGPLAKEDYEPFTPEGKISMSDYSYDPMLGGFVRSYKKGGSVPQLEDGGFVLTKKAVDGLGKGDNSRGQAMAARGLGAIPIKGKGHGTSDSIKTSIDGRVPARVSNGEAYVPRRAVKKAGGADKLYALMRKAERRA